MYFPLILFFGSLFGIIFMIWRKLLMLQNGQILNKEETLLETAYLEELKHLTIKNIKRHGYTGLVTIIRLYIKSSNFIKNKNKQIKIKIKDKLSKHSSRLNGDLPKSQEIPKFLKIISEYKQKIREIKHKIREEEERNF
ncbi:MAG: hypothetical protein AAB623_01200 [Patescibacteria group bacterium]